MDNLWVAGCIVNSIRSIYLTIIFLWLVSIVSIKCQFLEMHEYYGKLRHFVLLRLWQNCGDFLTFMLPTVFTTTYLHATMCVERRALTLFMKA